MQMKTAELTGAALDWAVGKAIGARISKLGPGNKLGVWIIDGESWYQTRKQYSPSTEWEQGGPIIDREGVSLREVLKGFWTAEVDAGDYEHEGPTPLIAAMRCYVASKLGDTIDIPEELK